MLRVMCVCVHLISFARITFIILNNHVFALSTAMLTFDFVRTILFYNSRFMSLSGAHFLIHSSIKVRKTAIKTTVSTNTHFQIKSFKGFIH